MNITKSNSYYFQLIDFLEHKKYILESGTILVKHLLKENKDEEAFKLLKRLAVHDNSKLEKEEFCFLCNIPVDLGNFINENEIISDSLKKSIELHWKHNKHHPEYFKDVTKMSEIDIMEMCCDWYARSLQYQTDFISFVKTRQETRFHFPNKMFDKILYYCEILNKEHQK